MRVVRAGVLMIDAGGRVVGAEAVDARVIRIAFALAEYDEAKYAHGDVQHTRQVVVVVDRQQLAVLVRVVDVKLDAAQAVQAFEQLIEIFEFARAETIKSEATKFGVVFAFYFEQRRGCSRRRGRCPRRCRRSHRVVRCTARHITIVYSVWRHFDLSNSVFVFNLYYTINVKVFVVSKSNKYLNFTSF